MHIITLIMFAHVQSPILKYIIVMYFINKDPLTRWYKLFWVLKDFGDGLESSIVVQSFPHMQKTLDLIPSTIKNK
jgi:hypothetical protein